MNRCRALFATHFHELTALAATLPRLHNATVRVKEWQGEVVFLHEVVPGAADRSYGIQVAKLAGLPPSVIERAKVVLAKLEAEDRATPRGGFDDLPLFAAPPEPAAPDPRQAALDALLAALQALNPDEMSPREALEALYALKSKPRSRRSAQAPRGLALPLLQPPEQPVPRNADRRGRRRTHHHTPIVSASQWTARKPSTRPNNGACTCAATLAAAGPPMRGCMMMKKLPIATGKHREHARGERSDAVARHRDDRDAERDDRRAHGNVGARASRACWRGASV